MHVLTMWLIYFTNGRAADITKWTSLVRQWIRLWQTAFCPEGSRDSLLIKAPDLWSEGCEFESRKKQRENFLPQSQLCVLTLTWCPFHPRVTAVARKTPRLFCQKYRWQVTPKHAYTWSNEVRVGSLCRRPGIVWEPSRKRAHTQFVREHSATVVSARWVSLDRSWPVE